MLCLETTSIKPERLQFSTRKKNVPIHCLSIHIVCVRTHFLSRMCKSWWGSFSLHIHKPIGQRSFDLKPPKAEKEVKHTCESLTERILPRRPWILESATAKRRRNLFRVRSILNLLFAIDLRCRSPQLLLSYGFALCEKNAFCSFFLVSRSQKSVHTATAENFRRWNEWFARPKSNKSEAQQPSQLVALCRFMIKKKANSSALGHNTFYDEAWHRRISFRPTFFSCEMIPLPSRVWVWLSASRELFLLTFAMKTGRMKKQKMPFDSAQSFLCFNSNLS